MTTKHADLVQTLRDELGASAVVDQPDALLTYNSDGCVMDKREPDIVVLPTHPDQVVSAVKHAYALNIPVVPRGAGTGLSGGATPMRGGMIIGTSRMDRVEEVDTANSRARIQPGVINFELSQYLKPYGYKYAPDPSSQKACTIGGNIATNSGGPHCLKYGVTTNHILGVELVMHDGTRLWTSDGVSDAAGYDLTGLVVGSEGTLGIVTRAWVRITRLPEDKRVVLALFPNIVSASEVVSAVVGAGHLPASLEMMDKNAIRAVNDAYKLGLPADATALLLIEVDGVVDGLDDVLHEIMEICEEYGAVELRPARTEAEQTQVWAARKNAFGALGRIAPAYYLVDTVVPRTKLPYMMEQIEKLGKHYNMPMANIFHAGDGNLHPLVLYNPRDPEEVHKAHAIAEEVMRLSIEQGGVISGEHGIGMEKQEYMLWLFSDVDLQAQAVVYEVFNPRAQYNPAKVFPKSKEPLQMAAARRQRIAATMNQLDRELLGSELESAIGSDQVLSGGEANAYAVQGMAPAYVAFPATIEELSQVMAICHQAGASVVAWGGGTQQNRGTLSSAPDVVLVTRRLNRVIKYDPSDLTIGVEAGVTLAELQTLLAENKQMLPFDAPLSEHATIGGLVATGHNGPRRGYGTLRDLLLGLTIVEVDGTIMHTGGQVVKNVSGYDLVKLMHGSYGTLGIIAAVRLKTLPRPLSESTLLTTFATRDGAMQMLKAVQRTQLTPTAVVYLDGNALQTAGLDGGSALLIRAEGIGNACVRHTRELTTMAEQHLSSTARSLQGDEINTLWDTITDLTATHTVQGDTALLRLAVLPGELATALDQIEERAQVYGIKYNVHAHALHGVIYIRAEATTDALHALHRDLLGRWRHCHVLASDPTRKEGMAIWGVTPEGIILMQALKQAFDPANKLNPGRYIV
ncbi:MAG: FAD-binding protein [Chloroflexaceae bacterium]|nr:FAD-binding protein [Chloroflexaceae bacterium]